MTKVLVFGTFDILHEGHRYFLKEAKKHGDRLFVVVAKDETVKRVKGVLPREDECRRMEKIDSLEIADKIILGHKTDYYSILSKLKPDIICLGYDQTAFVDSLEKELKKRDLKTRILRLDSFMPEKYKSSKLR